MVAASARLVGRVRHGPLCSHDRRLERMASMAGGTLSIRSSTIDRVVTVDHGDRSRSEKNRAHCISADGSGVPLREVMAKLARHNRPDHDDRIRRERTRCRQVRNRRFPVHRRVATVRNGLGQVASATRHHDATAPDGVAVMITFAHIWVFLFAPLPLLVRWLAPAVEKLRPAVHVPFLDRMQSAASAHAGLSNAHKRLAAIAKATVWILLVITLARPQWLEPPISRTIPTRDLLLLVDLSASMDQEDFTGEKRAAVNRLDAVKSVVGEFLLQREGDRVGLVVFGNSPFLQVPFTTDLELCRQLLDETDVGMAGPKTALGDAIGLGIQLFNDSDAPAKTIIALTDGNDTASGIPPVEASRVAVDRDITIHTVAIGDPTTVGEEKLDQESLKNVAQTTDGEFFLALNREELVGIYDRLDELETTDVKSISFQPRRDLYHWPLAAALLISMAQQLSMLRKHNRRRAGAGSNTRLTVNTRTFELEAVER